MQLITSLVNYPGITITTTFTISIQNCEITFLQFQTPSSTEITYNVDPSGTPLSVQIPQVLASPADCDAPLVITLVDANTNAPISWIMVLENDIMIATDNPSHAG